MMKWPGLILSIFLTSSSINTLPVASFKEEQLRFPRVRTAFTDKEDKVKTLFANAGLAYPDCDILIRGFKNEKELEVWAKDAETSQYTLVKTYNFCMLSGVLGPKRKQGDSQVPEGFYYIDRFNPASNFYLSLGINYPNDSDKKLSAHSNLGGDIFIHGNCVSIGCIPITDALIKELYVICVEAKSNGQSRIPVHIYPAKLSTRNLEELKLKYNDEPKLIELWENLQLGFAHFEKHKKLAKIGISTGGTYTFN